jgi:Glucose / Sorbosone dehydrogenase
VIGLGNRDDERLGPKFLTLEKVGRFNEPVYLTQAPGGDELYVVEKPGRVVIVGRDGKTRRQPFLDLRRTVEDSGKGGEQGLLSIAFPPDYADSGLFYVSYTDRRDALRIVEFKRKEGDSLMADRKSARLVLRIPQPTTKHHGGHLVFGSDHYLYVGAGDGGPSGDPQNNAQNKRVLLGKLLRIDPAQGRRKPYSVPKDNPFVGGPGRDEIYSYGLRNPWRFSFDRVTGVLTIGDVGNDRYEEINILPAAKARGANFGWAGFEANYELKPGLVPRGRTVRPVLAYPHGPGCAVTGGYVIRDPRLSRIAGREVIGRYVFGDFCSGRLFAFRINPSGRGRERRFRFMLPSLTSFGEDRAGRIYLIQQQGPPRNGKPTPGAIYRLDPARKRARD